MFEVIVGLCLALQHRVQPLEDRYAALEQLMVVQCDLDQAVDREIKARRLIPRELAVVQVGFVHDLGDRPDPAILDGEALDEGLERA